MCSKAKMYKEYFNESKKKCMIKKECKKIQNFSMKKQENVKINQNVKIKNILMKNKEDV